jgi:hypothetical protein
MAMPWQLREGLRRRVKGAPPRPIIENLPFISVNSLRISSLSREKTYTMPNVSLRYPFLVAARLSCEAVEFTQPSLHRGGEGIKQQFALKPIRTGFGYRHAFICECGRAVLKLYCLHRHIACRDCHNAVPASQVLGARTRPLLQIARIKSFLDTKSRLLRRTKERLKQRLGEKALMAQGRLGTDASTLWE